MKRALVVCGAAALSLSAVADVTLTGGNVEVVVAKGDAPTVGFAAGELTNFLSRVFSQTVPVVAAPTAGKASILLGRAGAAASGVDAQKLETDEFVVRTFEDGRIALFGRDHPSRDPGSTHLNGAECRFDHATLFAVYDFLEQDVGCRFYFPGELGECIPVRSQVSVRDGERRVKPAYRVRHWYDGGGVTWYGVEDKKELNRLRGLNMLRLRMETKPLGCCHGQNAFRYVERFGKSHPEYFQKMSNGKRFNYAIAPGCSKFGQICYSSGAMEEMYQDVKAYLTGQPASSRGLKNWGYNCGDGYVDIMSNDAFERCLCGKCEPRSIDDPQNYATEMVWEETAKLANRLKAEGVKGCVTQMAYHPYRSVPKVEIPDNVRVMVAETGPWSITNKKKLERDNDEIRRWAEKTKNPVWIWTYPGKYEPQAYPGIPHNTPRAVANYYKMVSPWIFGTFMESETDHYLFSHLNYYMLSRVSWDPSFDVEATLEEYYRLMYGKAAPAAKAFLEALEEKWLHGIVGNIIDTNLGPKAIQPPDAEIWNKLYTKAFLAESRAALTPFANDTTLEGRRVKMLLEDFLSPLEKQSVAFLDRQEKVSKLVYQAGNEPMTCVPFRLGKTSTAVRTEVTVRRAKGNLVVTYRCFEPEMDKTLCITHGKNDSGLCWKDNGVEFFLDLCGDRKHYYHLIVSTAGEIDDFTTEQLGNGARQPTHDVTWNSGATAKYGTFEGGYTLEITIPTAAFKEGIPDVFYANFCRNRILNDNSTFDLYTWSPYVSGYHDPMSFGTVKLGAK